MPTHPPTQPPPDPGRQDIDPPHELIQPPRPDIHPPPPGRPQYVPPPRDDFPTYVAPGERIVTYQPGDLLLCHGRQVVHKFVQVGQRLRMLLARVDTRRDRRDWCYYDHVAVCVGDQLYAEVMQPCVIEALPGKEGVRLTPLTSYDGREYHHVPVMLDAHDQKQVVRYLDACLPLKYGMVWHYFGMTLTSLSGGSVSLSGVQSEICSSMAAQALTRGDFIWDRPPACMMPADLARHFGVRRPLVRAPDTD